MSKPTTPVCTMCNGTKCTGWYYRNVPGSNLGDLVDRCVRDSGGCCHKCDKTGIGCPECRVGSCEEHEAANAR